AIRRCTPARRRFAIHPIRPRTGATGEHDHLPHVDLGHVPSLVFFVLPLPVLDAPLDEHLVALLEIALDDVGELAHLGIPDDAAMPLGFLLLVTRWSVPAAAGGE